VSPFYRLLSKYMVPPKLITDTLEKLVLPQVTGRYFDVDLKPPDKPKKGKKGNKGKEEEVPDAAVPLVGIPRG